MEEKDIQILKEMFRESEARMEAMMDRKIDALRTETNEKFEFLCRSRAKARVACIVL